MNPYGVDWLAFSKIPDNTCWCRCGGVFRSHAKTVKSGDRWLLVSRNPCPDCGKVDNLHRASTDPESYTIRKDDVS